MGDQLEAPEDKTAEIAANFIELYGPVAELEVSQRIVMFETEGNAAAIAAWRAVGDAIRRLRGGARA